jgi:hypothetical protein
MAHSYEEALQLFETYKPFVFAAISDARFLRGGKVDGQAGERFLSLIRDEVPDIPLLMLSSEAQNRQRAENIPAVFIAKQSPDIHKELHDFFLTYLGFGDFECPMVRRSAALQISSSSSGSWHQFPPSRCNTTPAAITSPTG